MASMGSAHSPPGTSLADQFGDWDEFVDAVEAADPAVSVVGVTDYVSINTYKTFRKYHDAGRRGERI